MLILKPTKTGVRFEYSDQDSETSITIDKTDTGEDMIRKLNRVIALMEGGQPSRIPPGVPEYGVLREPAPYLANAEPPTNGWATIMVPELPERLRGEVELVQPGEDA